MLVSPAPGRVVWMGAGGENDSPAFVVVIPRDLDVDTPVRIDVRFEEKAGGSWTMTAMSARLYDPAKLPNDFENDVEEVWKELWDVQRTELLSDLGNAGKLSA